MMSQWKIQSIYAQGCTTIPIPSGLVWLNTSSGVTYTTNYILADFDGNIVAISPSSTEFIPTPAAAFASGSYNIFGIQYDIANPPSPVPTIGGNLATIGSVSGCFELSEGIVYNCNTIDCFDPTQSFTYSISNADLSIGRSLTLFLADNSGNIIAQSGSPADFTTEVQQAYALGINSFYVYYLNSLNSEIPPATILAASNVNDLFLLPSSCRNADFEEDYIYFEFAPSITPITDISYAGPYCTTDSDPMPTTVAGLTTGGTYSAASGLTINPTTGVIDLSASSPGTYTVTYSIAASGCNPAGSSTAQLTITPSISPVTGINYNGPYCINDVDPSPVMAAGYTLGGSYVSTAGLVINSSTGVIDLSASSPGTYDITYTVVANGCNPQGSSTTSVTINVSGTPITDISYAGPYCTTDSDPIPTAVAGFTTGGSYSAASGLVINPTTGVIDLSASNPGTYTITYTIAASGCNPAGSSTAEITIENCCVAPIANAGSDQIVCAGELVQLGNFPVLLQGSDVTYLWTPNIDLNCNDCPNPISTTNIDRVYTLTVTNACGSYTDQVAIDVVSGTPFELGPAVELCSSEFPYTIQGPDGYATYIWSVGYAQLAQSQNFVINGPANYQLIAYDVNGCVFSDVIIIELADDCTSPILTAIKTSDYEDANNDGALNPGEQINYSISITNMANATATALNVSLFDPLPSELSYIDGSITAVSTGNGPAIADFSAGNINALLGNLAPGQSATVSFSALVNVPYTGDGTIENQGIFSADNHPDLPTNDPNTPVPVDPTTDPVYSSPILTALKTSNFYDSNDDGLLNPGEQFIYSITVTNAANATGTAMNVMMSDVLQNDVQYLAGSLVVSSQGSGTTSSNYFPTTIVASLGNLAPGQSAVISFVVIVDEPYTGDGTIENQAIFSADNHSDISTDNPATPQPNDPTINTISNPSGCQTFFVSHEINCLEDNLEYNVVLTIVGEPGQEFLVTSSHTGGYNGTTSSSIIDGPFSTDMGYSYTVTPVDDIDCSITVGEEYIECIVTPITLVSFNGVVEENRNLLKWTTGSEENNDYFILNRSLDGSLFESIAVIESTNGNGELINYSYADTDVKAGVYYYSLTQVDLDGTTSNSYIVTLVRNNHIVNNISLSPVPAHDLLQVSWTSEINGSQEIRVLDLTGRQVMTKEVAAVIGSNNIGLDISYLTNGAYFVEMTMKGQTNLVKMIKQ